MGRGSDTAPTTESIALLLLQKFAEHYPETIFLKLYGNSNANTKVLFHRGAMLWKPGFAFVDHDPNMTTSNDKSKSVVRPFAGHLPAVEGADDAALHLLAQW